MLKQIGGDLFFFFELIYSMTAEVILDDLYVFVEL